MIICKLRTILADKREDRAGLQESTIASPISNRFHRTFAWVQGGMYRHRASSYTPLFPLFQRGNDLSGGFGHAELVGAKTFQHDIGLDVAAGAWQTVLA